MRALFISILPLLVLGCAGHDAGSAVEVTAASSAARARLWPTVSTIVQSYTRERGFRLMHGKASSSRPNDLWYAVEAPDQPSATSLHVLPQPDVIRIELSEIGVSRPSRKQRDIQRALKGRLEAAGLVVSRTEPSIVVTF